MDQDFAQMRALGITSIRSYHVPPEWLLELAGEHGLAVFIDVPWRKHVCFLESQDAQAEARQAIQRAARLGRRHPCVLAYSIGNEIPPAIVRWHGARRVQRFLAELRDAAKQADPDGLVTYASYPPTEYLDPSFLDFATFNVYLHDREAFRRYLLPSAEPGRRPSARPGRARHGHAPPWRERPGRSPRGAFARALLLGLAGAFVFSWTDDWHTGGHPIEDWAFGITRADRTPKAAYHALQQVFQSTLTELLPGDAAGLGGRLLVQRRGDARCSACDSLRTLDYPDYEVIVVDDGSTDETRRDPRRVSRGTCHPSAEPGPERGPQCGPARGDGQYRRLYRFRLRRRIRTG